MQPCCRPLFWQIWGRYSSFKGSRVGRLCSSVRGSVDDSLQQHIVWIRGLPFNLNKTNVEERLQLCLPSARVFVKPAKSKRGDHAGWALAQWMAGAPVLPDVEAAVAGQFQRSLSISLAPKAVCPIDWVSGGQGAEERLLQLKREHQKNQRKRKQIQHLENLQGLLNELPPDEPNRSHTIEDLPSSHDRPRPHIDWASMPVSCKINLARHGGESSAAADKGLHVSEFQRKRAKRKEAQCESFLLVLQRLLGPHVNAWQRGKSHPDYQHDGRSDNNAHQHFTASQGPAEPGQLWRTPCVVEFGCGSGNLLLPLAWAMPHCHFHGVDCKQEAVQRLQERARAAGLHNVTASVEMIQDYSGPLDVALALHACGPATDYAMIQAQHARAAFIVSPCCIGKLNAPQIAATPSLLQRGRMPFVVPMPDTPPHHPESDGGREKPATVTGTWRQYIENQLQRPRSRWMREWLAGKEPSASFAILAKAADISDKESFAAAEGQQLCLQAKAAVLQVMSMY
ncbi:hypothetical protein DUNSADRAFT_4121 [Dunaliella salina]|uniref:Methyltransferase domain-containing protein n=1 Tax=Dunaliella salina TaxID=3046 RepID=A0ABQ7GSM5_DUNSA|nr:hypothetical protein DUNSADRAFT_4121 [Dunaliella salina]|eukprot:KAF5837619.1 hypothetical protein DUNSADRAFT_4121 [Dunaliella salina]